jgi:hypothetical protein
LSNFLTSTVLSLKSSSKRALMPILPKSSPSAAAADWTMVNADQPVAPDISSRLAGNAYLIRWKISHTPRKPAAEGAVTVRNPRGLAWQLYPDVAAVTASVDSHGDF